MTASIKCRPVPSGGRTLPRAGEEGAGLNADALGPVTSGNSTTNESGGAVDVADGPASPLATPGGMRQRLTDQL